MAPTNPNDTASARDGAHVAPSYEPYRNLMDWIDKYGNGHIQVALNSHARLQSDRDALLAALKDAEFLMRKAAINPKEAWAMQHSFKRSAEDAQAAIRRAEVA